MTKAHAIVDACVAASIGDPTCDQFVNARQIVDFLTKGHVGVFVTDELLVEWENHASKYMKSWLARMVSRGRSRHERDRKLTDYRKVLREVSAAEGKAALLKDAHLVEAAILHRVGVLSFDNKQREYLRNIVERYSRLGQVQWFHPAVEYEICLLWLELTCEDFSVARLDAVS